MTDSRVSLQEIRELSRNNQNAEAETAARALLERLPEAAETTFLLAYSVHQQGRLEEAIGHYELALRYAPSHPSALNNLGSILRQLGRPEDALLRFRQATEADPHKSWIWSNLSGLLEEMARPAEALEALKRAINLAPEDASLQDRLAALVIGPTTADKSDRKSSTEAMWRLNPAVRDFETMGFALRPYVERLCQPNYQSTTLTTDRHGFRHLWKDGRGIGYDEFAATPGPKGIICGASQALGYGIADAHTLQANLTFLEAGGVEWFSLAAPISQLFQQRLLFEIFAPDETKYCVVVSGTVNVLLSQMTEVDRAPYPPLHNVTYEWPPNEQTQATDTNSHTVFEDTLNWMVPNITMFAAKCRMIGDCRLLFCQPPVLPWCGKKPTEKEAQLCTHYRIRHPEYASLIEAPDNVPHWLAYLAALKESVEAEGGDYLEMSEEIDPKSEESLFCDIIHPNETGTKLMAACISDWAEGRR